MGLDPATLRGLGFVRLPNGDLCTPGAAKVTPRTPHHATASTQKNQPHASRLRHPEPQHSPAQALDRPAPAQAGRQEGAGRGPSRPAVALIITRHSTGTLDIDNFVGGCKPLIDAIRRASLIPDDDPASIDAQFRQVKCGRGQEKTEVEILFNLP